MNDDLDLGFDPRRTRDNFVAWLSENGVAVPIMVPDPALTEDGREARRWSQAKSAAMEHMNFHGVPCTVRVDGGEWQEVERCQEKPCWLCGVSCALYELCWDWYARGHTDFSIGVDSIAMVLGKLEPEVIESLDRAAARELRRMAEMRTYQLGLAAENEAAGKPHIAAIVRQGLETMERLSEPTRRSREAARRLAELMREAKEITAALKAGGDVRGTPHRPLPSERGPGRPKESLLNAVLQHLRNDDVEYRTIQELVAGMGGGATSSSSKAVKGQISKRIKGLDLRSIHPYEQ